MKDKFLVFLTTPVGSMLRIFVAGLIAYLVIDLKTDGKVDISWDEVNIWIAGALVVVLPIVAAVINPADTRWGRGSK